MARQRCIGPRASAMRRRSTSCFARRMSATVANHGGDAVVVHSPTPIHAPIARLLDAGASIRSAETVFLGQTLLMRAARAGRVDALKVLIGAGADANARETRTGTTAVIWAATFDRAAAVRALPRVRRRRCDVGVDVLSAHAERGSPDRT